MIDLTTLTDAELTALTAAIEAEQERRQAEADAREAAEIEAAKTDADRAEDERHERVTEIFKTTIAAKKAELAEMWADWDALHTEMRGAEWERWDELNDAANALLARIDDIRDNWDEIRNAAWEAADAAV